MQSSDLLSRFVHEKQKKKTCTTSTNFNTSSPSTAPRNTFSIVCHRKTFAASTNSSQEEALALQKRTILGLRIEESAIARSPRTSMPCRAATWRTLVCVHQSHVPFYSLSCALSDVYAKGDWCAMYESRNNMVHSCS